jgi:hypothetical protein
MTMKGQVQNCSINKWKKQTSFYVIKLSKVHNLELKESKSSECGDSEIVCALVLFMAK